MMNKTWKDITQYASAVAAMVSGMVMAHMQYFDAGDLTSGVLGYVGQTLMYAAGIFGVTMYWNGKYNELKQTLQTNGNIASVASSSRK